MPTQTDIETIMLLEVGAGLDAPSRPELDRLTPNIALLFNFYADKAFIFPRLQYLYAKRHLLMILQGTLRNKVTGGFGGMRVHQTDSVKAVGQMYKETGDEITRIEKWSRAVRPGVVQRAFAKVPSTPGILNPVIQPLPPKIVGLPNGAVPDGQGDPNAPAYRGDPLIDSNGTFGNTNVPGY